MTEKICKIKLIDQINCRVSGLDMNTNRLCIDKLKVFVPSARYMPAYKLGRFDGYIRYYSPTGQTTVTLLSEILPIILKAGYTLELEKEASVSSSILTPDDIIDENYLSMYRWPEGHKLAGQPVILGERQVRAANALITHQQGLGKLATNFGKTLLCVALGKKILEKGGKLLIIVPKTDLVVQTAQDFINFGIPCGRIGGKYKEFDKPITVSTWQSLHSANKRKKDDELSEQELATISNGLSAILMDETHTVTGKALQQIFTKTFKNVPIRWGISGTIHDDKPVEYYPLLNAIGPIVVEVNQHELQETGISSSCSIKVMELMDDNEFTEFGKEQDFLSRYTERTNFIANFIANLAREKGNTVVLIPRIKLGENLSKTLNKMGVENVFLSGKDDVDTRLEYYKDMNNSNGKIILATRQILSTGLNIPRIFNLVFIDIGKSYVTCIQSVGRGLRTHIDKNHIDIYDICSSTTFSKRHIAPRIKYYKDEQFPVEREKISTWKL